MKEITIHINDEYAASFYDNTIFTSSGIDINQVLRQVYNGGSSTVIFFYLKYMLILRFKRVLYIG